MIAIKPRLLICALLCISFSSSSLAKITLYQPDVHLEKCLSSGVSPIVDYIESAMSEIEHAISQSEHPSTSFAAVIAFKPGQLSKAWTVDNGNHLADTLKSKIIDIFSGIPVPPISCNVVLFSIQFDVQNGGQPVTTPENPFAIPDPWKPIIERSNGSLEVGLIALKAWEQSECVLVRHE